MGCLECGAIMLHARQQVVAALTLRHKRNQAILRVTEAVIGIAFSVLVITWSLNSVFWPPNYSQSTSGTTTSSSTTSSSTTTTTTPGGNAPTAGTAVCATSGLHGPTSAPGGFTTIAAGDNSSVTLAPSTSYWLAPGNHTFSTNSTGFTVFTGDVLEGGYNSGDSPPEATLEGTSTANGYAIDGSTSATGVTVEYLTVTGWATGNNNALINSNDTPDWTVAHNTIGPNYGTSSYQGDEAYGYGVNLGTGDVLTGNCITENNQGGYNVSCTGDGTHCPDPNSAGGADDITIQSNEITQNGIGYYPDNADGGGGNSGGGKLLWATNVTFGAPGTCATGSGPDGSDTVSQCQALGNWVDVNYYVGTWFDFNNAGLDVNYNVIQGNFGYGLDFEASANVQVLNNLFEGNGTSNDFSWPSCSSSTFNGHSASCADGEGPIDGSSTIYSNYTPAIYISSSGGTTISGSSGLVSSLANTANIEGDVFTNNWDGIDVYQDRNRFCGSPYQLNCPLVNPSTYYDNAGLGVADGVTNGTTAITSAAGFKNIQTGAGTTPANGDYVWAASTCGGGSSACITAGDTISTCASANACTLTTPAVGTGTSVEIGVGAAGGCGVANLNGTSHGNAYFNACTWASQNVTAQSDVFNMAPTSLAGCVAPTGSPPASTNLCGYQALWGNSGSCSGGAPNLCGWSPYAGSATQNNVVLHYGNLWSNNVYTGTWAVACLGQGTAQTYANWQGSTCGSQDGGSTGL
jgi:hypothetical protein